MIGFLGSFGILIAAVALAYHVLNRLSRIGGALDEFHDEYWTRERHCKPDIYDGRVRRFMDANRTIVTKRITPVARRQRYLRRFA